MDESFHSEEITDIIHATPSWLVRWGIALFLGMFLVLGLIGSVIKYPDMVRAPLVLNSSDMPKEIVAKVNGKLVDILVKENQLVDEGQPLAFLESTADHREALQMLAGLKEIQAQLLNNKVPESAFFDHANNTRLGELQIAYETFFEAYVGYKATLNQGYYSKIKAYLQTELKNLEQQKMQLGAQMMIQQKDSVLAEAELAMHKELASQKVEAPTELRQEESKYLAKRQPLVSTKAAILTSEASWTAKQKEITDLDNQVYQNKEKFLEALNSLLSQAEDWRSKYVLSASQKGKVLFDGPIQQKQVLEINQEVFHINSGNEHFFGLINLPQTNMGKVKEGLEVLIKLRGYPFEQYGILRGKISSVSEIPYHDSTFISSVEFDLNGFRLKSPAASIELRQGMLADAEIITQDATLLQRILRSILRSVNSSHPLAIHQ